MPELSRAQVAVYAAIAVALLLVGARAIRAEGDAKRSFAAAEPAAASSAGGFAIAGQAGDVVVDVTGAVARPGVYRLPLGSRVADAIARAGGPGAEAELEAVNRAARLVDGQQVVVPRSGPAGVAGVGSVASEDGPISLNTATAEQLDTIEGIGPVTAADILRFRDEHGGLASVDQLGEVSGIGPATMESLRARLQP